MPRRLDRARRHPLALAAAVAFIVLITDVLTKQWIEANLGPDAGRSSIEVLGTWLELIYARNQGVAFGLLSGYPSLVVVLTVLGGALLGFLLLRTGYWSFARVLSAGLIFGGGAGNLLQRLWSGYVVDFVSVGRWPAFNVADSAITIGVLLFLYTSLVAESSSGGSLRLAEVGPDTRDS